MSSKMSVREEIKEQNQKTKDMPLKGKLSYFWCYYKIHTIVAIAMVLFIISFIRQIATSKPYAFYAILLNANNTSETMGTSALWADEFQTFAEIDPDTHQVYFDTSVTLTSNGNYQYDINNITNNTKMTSLLSAGEIHAILANTQSFESYAHQGSFYDLTTVFTEEELAPYQDYLYYTDAAAFNENIDATLEEMEAADQKFYEQTIDHRDPSGMEKPVAVGIRIPDTGNKLAESGYYTYLQDDSYVFQGYPEETVIGIPTSVEEPQITLKFVEYLLN